MIANWLYFLTKEIGRCLNNALGFENSEISNVVSGVLFLWVELILVLATAILFSILCLRLTNKKEKEK